MKRLLIYNWTHIVDNQGGGVNLYVKNLINKLLDKYEVYYINSGLTYTKGRRVDIVKTSNPLSEKIHTYEIINSPFVAPVRQNGKNLKMYLEDESVSRVFFDFIQTNEIDIIHFNNIEGLPINALKVKERFPEVRTVYTAHNYFLLCSRANLWQNGEGDAGRNCCKKSFNECNYCYKQSAYYATILSRVYLPLIHLDKISRNLHLHSDPSIFERFQKETIKAINKEMDTVLAVSKRVAELLVNGGVDEKIVSVSYIGTKVAEKQLFHSKAQYEKVMKIIYMGYMQKEKGFYFFLDALDKLDGKIAKNIEVHIVARYKESKNKNELKRISELKNKYHDIILVNGYNPDNQEEILQDIHLGVVPVLWEDNLPQVAIEQVAYGVPILTSNLGGAQELHGMNREFTFIAGDYDSFLQKLTNIFYNRNLLSEFWNNVMHLVTMEEHINELRCYYEH